ncbi:Putative SOS response-associated peptidase YedK [Ferrimonas sediminum]|uniref:Abasic site processing protein n=1 Tax=Ferrimonas sediminum TaxID=718193 RepID=A0A1G8Q0U2_9GAMM|nr:SOS response-associated peptidase family protein [Ferrimonas sediminum]SDI98317.1 Putative SOS response-associated peptidase YedK [Ferrimonas sediminum]
MCGRFFSLATGFDSCEQLGMDGLSFLLDACDDIRPSQLLGGVTLNQGQLQLRQLQWGLSHPSLSRPVINARSETLAEKPLFKEAYASRRCLVPASGWYEWRTEGGRKQPYRFVSARPLFSFAGLWWPATTSRPDGALVLVTQAATESLKAYHHRMPVLVRGAAARDWLQQGRMPQRLPDPVSVTAYHSTGQPIQGQLF